MRAFVNKEFHSLPKQTYQNFPLIFVQVAQKRKSWGKKRYFYVFLREIFAKKRFFYVRGMGTGGRTISPPSQPGIPS